MATTNQTTVAELGPLWHRFGEEIPRGTVIFKQGDRSTYLFWIVQGDVVFTIDEPGKTRPHIIRRLGAGAVFGEMSCFSGEPRSATATAVARTLALRLSRDAVLQLVESRPAFAMKIIHTLAERLRSHLGAPGEQT